MSSEARQLRNWSAYEALRMERDEAREQRDRARALACRYEEELAMIRRALSARREHT